MLKNKLKELGFSDNLSAVYLKLFETGRMKAGEVINQTGLHRSVVYAALDELTTRGLISRVKKRGVAFFNANDPNKLVEEMQQKIQLSETIAAEIKKQQIEQPREVIVSEGLDAIMQATDRSLLSPPGETMYVMGASAENVQPVLDKHWRKYYHKHRIKKGIKFRGLYDRTVPQEAIEYRNNMELSEARYLPNGLEMPIWFNVCANIVSIMVPGEDPPLVFTIRSRATAEAIKKYFNYLWKLSAQ